MKYAILFIFIWNYDRKLWNISEFQDRASNGWGAELVTVKAADWLQGI